MSFTEVDVEALAEKVTKEAKSDYQMVRGPRPWEEDTLRTNAEIRRKAQEEGKLNVVVA